MNSGCARLHGLQRYRGTSFDEYLSATCSLKKSRTCSLPCSESELFITWVHRGSWPSKEVIRLGNANLIYCTICFVKIHVVEELGVPKNATSGTKTLQMLLTSPDLRPRGGVCGCLAPVGIDHDAGVILGRISRNIREEVTAGLCGAASSDLNLSAFCVELRAVGLVEGKEFVTDEVVSGGKRRRDAGLPVQFLENIVISPGSATQRRSSHSLLVNLFHVSFWHIASQQSLPCLP